MNENEKVKVGDFIEIIDMQGEQQYSGRTGYVTHIDAIGQIHGSWGGCVLIPNEDSFNVLKGKGGDVRG